MALDAEVLKSMIRAELTSAGFKNQEYNEKFLSAIAKSVVDHIQNSAEINTTGTAVVSAGSSAGIHPTTATGTIR